MPYLRRLGIPPHVAEAWGVGWCPAGPLRGRIVFPIRRADGILVGYTGLDPALNTPTDRWLFTEDFRPELELFGIERLRQDERVKKAAFEHGVTLVDDPLEVLRATQTMSLPVVSPMGAELSRAQIEFLLNPAINPTGRLRFAGEVGERGWMRSMRRWGRLSGSDRPNRGD